MGIKSKFLSASVLTTLGTVLALGGATGTAFAEESESGLLGDVDTVHTLDITIDQTTLTEMIFDHKNPEDEEEGFYDITVTIDGVTYEDAGLKPTTDRGAILQVEENKFALSRKGHIREVLSADVLGELGFDTPTLVWGVVDINETVSDLFTLVEIDEDAERAPGQIALEGVEAEDFKEFLEDSTDEEFEEQIGDYIDVESFFEFAAFNKVLGHGKIPGQPPRDHKQGPDKGAPQVGAHSGSPKPQHGKDPLFERMLSIDSLREQYVTVVEGLLDGEFADLTARVDDLAALILAANEDNDFLEDQEEFESHVEELKEKITENMEKLEEELAELA